MMRVRFPPPAPSQSIASFDAHVAQLVEHFLGKEEVTGSNPVMSSIFIGFAVECDSSGESSNV